MKPAAWLYHVSSYADHAPASGVVIKQSDLGSSIPADKVTWTPLFILGTWNPDETPEELAERLKKINAFVALAEKGKP